MKDAALGDDDEFGITAVAMFADHFGSWTELFVTGATEGTLPAGHQIMEADAVPDFELRHR